MTASPQPPPNSAPGPAEEAVFRCLESDDPDRELVALAAEDPELAQQARTLLVRLDRQGLLADPGDERDMPDTVGRYRLLRRLGRGGMGLVYEAHDGDHDRCVAVKLIRPDMLPFAKTRQRFENEIQALASLQHPGIVQVFESGEENGLRYYAMEFVAGESLQQILWRLRGRNPSELRGLDLFASQPDRLGAESSERSVLRAASWVDACVRIVRDMAHALAHAHAHGILHRDVKPGNIMFATDGRPRLLDFGLARAVDAQTMTRTGTAIGSLPYMAPEQVRGDRDAIDERTDVYALGVVLYELLALQQPFLDADNPDRTRSQVLCGRAPALRACNPAVPAEIERVCRRAMAMTPARRYAAVAQFAGDLDAVLAGRPLTTGSAVARFVQRNPMPIVMAGVAAVLAALGLAVQLGSTASERQEAVAANASLQTASEAAARGLQAARFDSYRLHLSSAKYLLNFAHLESAEELLQEAPEELRSWQWNHLLQRTQLDAKFWRMRNEAAVHEMGAGADRYAFLGAGNRLLLVDPDEAEGVAVACVALGGKPIQSASRRHLSANGRTMASLSKADDRHLQIGLIGEDRIITVTLDRPGQFAQPSRDGRQVWVANKDGSGQLLDAATGDERFRTEVAGCEPLTASFSDDGRFVCVGLADRRLQLWECSAGRLVWQRDNAVHARRIAFGPDGEQIHALQAQDRLFTFRSRDGKRIRDRHLDHATLRWGQPQPRESSDFLCDPDGVHLWTRHSDGFLRCLHLPSERWVWQVPAFALHFNYPTRVASFAIDSHRGRLLVGNAKGVVADYDLRSLKAAWLVPEGAPCYVAPTQNLRGDLFVGVYDGPPTLRRAGHDPMVLEDLPRLNICMFLDDTRVVLGPRDADDILLYDIDRGAIVATLQGSPAAVRSFAMLSDGRLASGDVSGGIHIWDLASGACEQILEGHTNCVMHIVVLPDGRLASASWDGSVRIWDLATGKTVWQYQLCARRVLALAASPDGRWLAMGGDTKGARIVDLRSGDVLPIVIGKQECHGLTFAADSRRLIIAGKGSGYVRLYEAGSWREVALLYPRHNGHLRMVGWAADGTTLLTADQLGIVRTWRSE